MMIKQNKSDFFGNVPSELLNQQQWWIAWYAKAKPDGSITKPPLTQRGYSVSKDYKGVQIKTAWRDAEETVGIGSGKGGVGFLASEEHGYVFFDFDHVGELEHLPSKLKNWLVTKDAYTEKSPSGNGFRVIMKCIDKYNLSKTGQPVLLKELCGEGSLYISSGYVTVTGNYICGDGIPEVSSSELEQWFVPTKAEVIQLPVDFSHPDLELITDALSMCKLDQSERVKKVYSGIMKQDYNHYDYWFKILSACHNYATVSNQMNEMTKAVCEWSQTDEISYDSDDDVITHWISLSNNDSGVTYSTLMKFAQQLQFKWPAERYDSKGNPTGKPVFTNTANMSYLLEDYFNLKFFWDTFGRKLYATGDKDTIDKYFMSRGEVNKHFGMIGPYEESVLDSIIADIAQANKYSECNVNSIRSTWRFMIAGKIQKINSFKEWLSIPANELPDDLIEANTDLSISNVEGLMSCFKFSPNQNMELIEKYFEVFIHSVVMPTYNLKNRFAQRPFIFLLAGPEACRKSTFCENLFPANLRGQFVTNSSEMLRGDKSYRDFKIQMIESVMIIIDEFENMYNKDTDSMLKFLITTDNIDYSPIYAKHTEKYVRNAAIIATTNKMNFPFEREGSRRLAIIKVDWIDTDKLEKINKHHLFRSYALEGKKILMNGGYPWHMPKEYIQLQYKENERFRAPTSLEINFDELFDKSIPPHNYRASGVQGNPLLWTQKELRGILMQRGWNPTTAALVNELKRYCGAYTHTLNKYEAFGRNNSSTIESGVIKTKNHRTLYVMPPLREGSKSDYTF